MDQGSPSPRQCVQCACKLEPAATACPECGRAVERAPQGWPKGLGAGPSALLMLWSCGLLMAALWSGDVGYIVPAAVLHVVNGPTSLVLIRNSYVPEQYRTWRLLGDLSRRSPAVAVMAFLLLGLTWLLPVLALGGCVCIIILASLK